MWGTELTPDGRTHRNPRSSKVKVHDNPSPRSLSQAEHADANSFHNKINELTDNCEARCLEIREIQVLDNFT